VSPNRNIGGNHTDEPELTDDDSGGIQLALIVVCSCGLGLILLIVPFDKIIRTDGTKGEQEFRVVVSQVYNPNKHARGCSHYTEETHPERRSQRLTEGHARLEDDLPYSCELSL
jgi:hypothetical protein